MKLDTFNTLVEGNTVYKFKPNKAVTYLFFGAFIAIAGVLFYRKFFRTPKFIYINSDTKINRVQYRLDNNNKITYYINAGETKNIGNVTITATSIKQSDSDLITGITLTEKSNGEVVKEQTINY